MAILSINGPFVCIVLFFFLSIHGDVVGAQPESIRFCSPWRASLFIREALFNSECVHEDKKEQDVVSAFSSAFGSEYTKVSDARIGVHGDKVVDNGKLSGLSEKNLAFHVPSELKSVESFNWLKRFAFVLSRTPEMTFEGAKKMNENEDGEFFFPRTKHFRKKLPKLTPEPYQRVMTFAIEVCMVPSIRYLELIHCMYMGMAPFFDGMLMSYSLQDVVGTAVKTVGYQDLNFSMENCRNAVSMVSDDSISPNYEYICQQMKACMESKVFENTEYSRFKKEFQERINNAYKTPTASDEKLNGFASQLLRLGVSVSPHMKGHKKGHVVRNFVPVRTMISMISVVNITKKFDTRIIKISNMLQLFYELLSHGMLLPVRSYFKYCKRLLKSNIEMKFINKGLLLEYLCKDFVSAGFIDEGLEVIGADKEKFAQAVKPSRILQKNYASVVPSMVVEKEISSYDAEWLEFVSTEPDATKAPISRRPPLTKFYKSKLLSKTKRKGDKDPHFVRSGMSSRKKTRLEKVSSMASSGFESIFLSRTTRNGFSIMGRGSQEDVAD